MEVIDKAPEGFDLLSGDDNLTLSIMALGGKGVVSVNGQAFPAELSSMIDLCISGNIQDARAVHYSLFKITKMLFQEGNPSGVKALLEYMKISSSNVRLPLWPVTNELRESICNEAARMGF
jgi:4-hydroxy-tetrahydrodipicolinate synthase